MWRTSAVLLVLAASACASGAASVRPAGPVAARPAPPAVVAPLDACQRALRPLLASAQPAPEIRLLSADADPDARSYDAWLRALSAASSVRYRWVSLDDPRGKELARALGLNDGGIVVDMGVDAGAARLRGPAAIATAVRDALHLEREATTNACDAASLPPSTGGVGAPSRRYEPREPLVGSSALARVTTLRIDEPGRSVTLVKDGAGWKLASGERADEDNVRHALDQLSDVRLGGVIAEGSRADERLGLDPAHATRVVASAGSETLVDLTLGRTGSRGTAVRLAGTPDARVLHRLGEFYFHRERRLWRDRTIWQIDPNDVRRVEITNRKHEWVLGREHGTWRATLDGRPFAPFDAQRADLLLRAFRRPPADDFAEPGDITGLDKASRVLRFVMTDGSVHALRIGAERPNHTFYAQVEGARTVYLVVAFQASFADASPARWRRATR